MSFFKQSINILFILGYFSLKLYGQSSTSTIDSLNNVLQKQQEDSNKVNSLLEISGYYIGINDFPAALNHANRALNFSRKINFKKGEGYSFLKIGWANYRLNNYREAEKNDSLALNCFKEINSREDIARAYIALGWVGSYGNNWPQAIRNTLQAIKIFEELGNKKEVAAGHFWVGFVYYWNADYDPAYTSLTLALKKYEEIDHDGHNGECYIYIANIYRIRGKYKEALDLDSIGLKMAVAKNDRQMAANAYFSMGDIISEQVDHAPISGKALQEAGSLNKASELYHEALNNFRAAGDPGGIGDCYGRISEINLRLSRIPEAQRYADSALSLAREVRFKDNLKTAYLVMARVDSAKGNFKS